MRFHLSRSSNDSISLSLAVMSGLTTIGGLNLPRSDKREVMSNTRRNFSKIGLGHVWPILNLPSLKKSLIDVRLMSGRASLSSFKLFCDLLYLEALGGDSFIP